MVILERILKNRRTYRDTSWVALSEDDRKHYEGKLQDGSVSIDNEGVVRIAKSAMVLMDGMGPVEVSVGLVVDLDTGRYGTEMEDCVLTDGALSFFREKTGTPQARV